MKRMIYGVDLGWTSQLEAMGYHWMDERGGETDIFTASKELGANAVRLRVFVDPPKEAVWQKRPDVRCLLGFCDRNGALAMAERAKAQGMRWMLDFHYSDHFADPEFQDMPEAWKGKSGWELERLAAEHTRNVMELLRDHGVCPDWVQVGNEINNGMMRPAGDLKKEPEQLVRLLNAGYDAVKEVCPDCRVITHLASVMDDVQCLPFLENFFARGGKTDILGFSYYPYWEKFESDSGKLAAKLKEYKKRYHKPVMIAEVGGLDYDEEGSYQIVADCIRALEELKDQDESGVFYWEPEAAAEILPDKYPLGASKLVGEKTLQYTKVLQAYRDYHCSQDAW